VQPAGLGAIRPNWEKAMCAVARDEQDAVWTAFEADPQLADRAHQLALEKYSQTRYNQRR
jgi:hypothetical protein